MVKIFYKLNSSMATASVELYKIRNAGNKFSYWDKDKNDWSEEIEFGFTFQPKPIHIFELEEMEQVSQEFHSMGFSPSSLSQKVGELHATKAHLEDMRKLVFEVKQ